LAESLRLLRLPGAEFGVCRGRREHENHRVGLADQVAEASLPVLATGDALAVDEALKAAKIECGIKLVCEIQVVAPVEEEKTKVALVGGVGSARLVRSYITGFRRSRTGCVMRDVCHCAAPIAALNSSTFGKVGESATRPPSLGVAASRVGFSRCIMKGRVTE